MGGEVRLGLSDDSGKDLDGYSCEEAIPIKRTGRAIEAVWNDVGRPWSHTGQLRLRLCLHRAVRVCSYTMSSVSNDAILQGTPATEPPVSIRERSHSHSSLLKVRGDGFALDEVNRSWDPWSLRLHDGSLRLYFLTQTQASPVFWHTSRIATAVASSLSPAREGLWNNAAFVTLSDGNRLLNPSEYRFLAGCARLLPDKTVELLVSTAPVGSRLEGPIHIATSSDGVHFVTRTGLAPLLPSGHYHSALGSSLAATQSWRDPFYFLDPKSGKEYLFFSANGAASAQMGYTGTDECHQPDLKAGMKLSAKHQCFHDSQQGLIGVAVRDSESWRLLPPAAVEDTRTEIVIRGQSAFYEMERPRVLYRNGRYHLFFHCWTMHVLPEWIAQHLSGIPAQDFSDTSLYHFISDHVEGPYEPYRKAIVPGSGTSGIYGTHFVEGQHEESTTRVTRSPILGWNVKTATLELSGAVSLEWDEGGSPWMRHSHRGGSGGWKDGPKITVTGSKCLFHGELICNTFGSLQDIHQLRSTEPAPEYVEKQFQKYRKQSLAVCYRFLVEAVDVPQGEPPKQRSTVSMQCIKRHSGT